MRECKQVSSQSSADASKRKENRNLKHSRKVTLRVGVKEITAANQETGNYHKWLMRNQPQIFSESGSRLFFYRSQMAVKPKRSNLVSLMTLSEIS
mgnify:CR=1 FL=1